MEKEITLTVRFLNKVLAPRTGKILRVTESNNSYSYTGATKKECIEKAKKAMRYNSSYKKTWSINETPAN
jgi:hypothetical protein